MTIATLKKDIQDLKGALNTRLPENQKAKIREQLEKSEKTLAEMESAKTPTSKKNVTKKANVVAKKSTSVLQKIKQANKKAEPKKSTPAKKSTAKQPSVLQKIKNQVKLNKNLSGYKKSGIDLLRDGNRPALPSGKRISKDGNPYYEYRLNRVDVRQPSKKVAKPNKLEDGGMMAKGGVSYGNFGSGRLNKNAWVSANYIGDSKVTLGDLQSYLERNTNEKFDKDKIYTITRNLFHSGEYVIEDNKDWKESKIYRKRKMADGGMMANSEEIRGGIRYVKGKELEWYDIIGFDVADYGEKEAERKAYDYIQDSIKYWNGELNEEDFKVRRIGGGKDYKGRAFDSWVVMRQFPKYADGGVMAKGGVMKPLTYYVYETPKITINWRGKTQPYGRFKSAEDALIFIKNISQTNAELSEYSIVTPDAILKVSDYMADGGMMAKGGRLKSALMRDRAFKSNEPHEQAYTRKTKPKNPKYNYGFFADGGEVIMTDVYAKKDGKVVKVNERPMELKEAERFVKEQGIEKYYTDIDFKFINKDFGYAEGGMYEMHRAYAMGGVLQHGLENGDFIVSHDEGKMIIMNGGNKYEVNIHSGSRTKID
jgi:hypothetical protein